MTQHRKLSFERVEFRRYLSAISFLPRDIVARESTGVNNTWAAAGDIDGDGDSDIVTASAQANSLQWLENADGKFVNSLVVGEHGPESKYVTGERIAIADLDGDGDNDVLSATTRVKGDPSLSTFEQKFQQELSWFENINGNGLFSTQKIIHSVPAFSLASFVMQMADLDSDGDIDIVLGVHSCDLACSSGEVAWYANDGSGVFVDRQVISDSFSPESLAVADLDQDGDLDIAVGARGFGLEPDVIVWFENDHVIREFSEAMVIATIGQRLPTSVLALDLNVDGDNDIAVASFGGNIDWHENLWPEQPTFSEAERIATVDRPSAIRTADIDIDGDTDFVGLVGLGASMQLVWFENVDSVLQNATTVATVGRTSDVLIADFDNDGDHDLLGLHIDRITLYENRLSGDINDDGEVAFDDFLTLSSNFGNVDTVWSDGDLNLDGRIDFSDFLILSDSFEGRRS